MRVSIFERFKRGGSQEPEPGGLGLGLWISRSIVERHGGSITAARTAEGFTRFTFTLPVEPTEGDMKILVADDDLDLLGLVAYSLGAGGLPRGQGQRRSRPRSRPSMPRRRIW